MNRSGTSDKQGVGIRIPVLCVLISFQRGEEMSCAKGFTGNLGFEEKFEGSEDSHRQVF